jgi:hypothetical protein
MAQNSSPVSNTVSQNSGQNPFSSIWGRLQNVGGAIGSNFQNSVVPTMQNIGGAINSFRNAMNNPNPGTNINAQGGAGNQPYVETPLPQTQTQNNTSTGSSQNSGSLTSLPGGGQTTVQGGYAGNPANNPYYTAPSSQNNTSTTAPTTTNNQNSMMTPGGGYATPGSTVNGVGTNLFPGVASSLASTQPYSATGNAVNTSQSLATGYNQTPQQSQNTQNVNSGAQVSGNIAQNQTPAVQGAYNALASFNQADPLLRNVQASIPMAAVLSEGSGAQFANALSNQQQALNNTYNAAITGEGQQLTGANQQAGAGQANINSQLQGAQQAGQISNAAQQNQIGAQQTVAGLQYGTPATAGAGGGNLDPQTYASQLAQQVISGKMTLAQAQSSMGYAGNAGGAMLQQAITSASPGFNFNQAAENSSIQGQIGPQSALAQGEIQNLQTALANAPALQQTTIPAVNAVAGWINDMLGNPNSKALSDAQSTAVTAVQTALSSAYGGTPTSFDSLTSGWFPPGATSAQIQAGLQQFAQLMTLRANAYNSPGTTPQASGSNGATGGSSTSGGSGTVSTGGYNYVMQNGKYVVVS